MSGGRGWWEVRTNANRDIRLKVLNSLLPSRGYNAGIVNGALKKARGITLQKALKKVGKEHKQIPVFVVQYDRRLPSITTIASRRWRSMVTRAPTPRSVSWSSTAGLQGSS